MRAAAGARRLAGGVLAFATISDDVLERAKEPERQPCQEAIEQVPERHCAVAGTPLHSAGAPGPPRRRGERPRRAGSGRADARASNAADS